MTKFDFMGEWPPEARAAVEAALSGLDWLVPDWCSCVALRWSIPEDSEASASTSTNYAYRFATIYCHPPLLSEDPGERRHSMTHELLHVFIGPLAEYAENMVDRLLDDAPLFRKTVKEEISQRHESGVQDLAFALHRRFGEPLPKPSGGPK